MSDNDDEQTKPDMTRIEDLSEFLHEDDPDTNAQLDEMPPTPDEEEHQSFETMSVDDLEDSPPTLQEDDKELDEDPPSFSSDSEDDENSFTSESTQSDFEVPTELSSDDEEESSFNADETGSFGSESDDDDDNSFSTDDSSEFGSDDSDSFSLDDDKDDSFSMESDSEEEPIIDEIVEVEQEAQLQEEVDQEIQEALGEDTDEQEEDQFESTEESQTEGEALSFDEIENTEDHETQSFEEEASSPQVMEDFTSEPVSSPTPSAPREAFKDVNEFGNAITYGQVTAGGNPPFSIILRKIKYLEDSERIIEILREHGLCDESNESDYQQGLSNGSMLISQLGEYSAIYLSHRFRRFDLEILVGLADEIHPSKNYDMDYKGLVRKENLRQNKNENFSLEDQLVEVDSILLATTPTLESYKIDRYLGVISTHVMIDESEFQKLQDTDTLNNEIDPDELLRELDEEASKTATVEIGLEEIYQTLAESLKVKAFKLKGNAVVGINYQITPLINQKTDEQVPSIRYKISCTGNAVWVGGKEAPRSEA